MSAAMLLLSSVADILTFKLSGFVAWFLWRTIYLMKLPGLDRKVRVAVDWALDLLLPPDITPLKTQETPGFGREHFETSERGGASWTLNR